MASGEAVSLPRAYDHLNTGPEEPGRRARHWPHLHARCARCQAKPPPSSTGGARGYVGSPARSRVIVGPVCIVRTPASPLRSADDHARSRRPRSSAGGTGVTVRLTTMTMLTTCGVSAGRGMGSSIVPSPLRWRSSGGRRLIRTGAPRSTGGQSDVRREHHFSYQTFNRVPPAGLSLSAG